MLYGCSVLPNAGMVQPMIFTVTPGTLLNVNFMMIVNCCVGLHSLPSFMIQFLNSYTCKTPILRYWLNIIFLYAKYYSQKIV